jgi:hypothetical protein
MSKMWCYVRDLRQNKQVIKIIREKLTVKFTRGKDTLSVALRSLRKWRKKVSSKVYTHVLSVRFFFASYFFILFPCCDTLFIHSLFCSSTARKQGNANEMSRARVRRTFCQHTVSMTSASLLAV